MQAGHRRKRRLVTLARLPGSRRQETYAESQQEKSQNRSRYVEKRLPICFHANGSPFAVGRNAPPDKLLVPTLYSSNVSTARAILLEKQRRSPLQYRCIDACSPVDPQFQNNTGDYT